MVDLWKQTGNQIVERKNTFLKNLAIAGLVVVYRTQVTTGGDWDPVTDTRTGATTTMDVDLPLGKAALMVPIKSLASHADGSVKEAGEMVVAGGRTISGVDISKHIIVQMHLRVPLNFNAIYVIADEPYKLSKVLSSKAVGQTGFWNEVMLEKA